MKIIKSLDNQTVRQARKLHQKKYRDQAGLFLMEGRRSVQEALARPELLRAIFIEESLAADFSDLDGLDSYIVDNKLLKHICTTENPQGIAAIVKKPEWSLEDFLSEDALIVLLDQIADPGNMGSIIRTCWGLESAGIILTPGCVDPFSPKVVRSSMGGVLNLPLLEIKSAAELSIFSERGYELIGTALENACNYYDTDLSKAKILVFGSEATGISPNLKKRCSRLIKIPTNPKIDSLNVAAACAIIVAEAWRQRR
ncbi:Alpha/beta knot methyltransferases [Syntrophomonas zehnderi OL-4]|uniref:Alpha/beta knot methyltransferases n=1 Tax=Syntrophomonas zehnderi OL-4 TaxID=690567 RepID=A0A0E4C8M6_9FIRM|nr:RNA methyltransferase [Syntrophomonas zehnderi]CFX53951.1 Alpha/beta knot methyltransferases [Syntrophomonas zehnderi OL-4]